MVTTKQLAMRAGVSREWIRYLCATGQIKAEKPGTEWIIPNEEAEQWLKEREGKRKKSTSD